MTYKIASVERAAAHTISSQALSPAAAVPISLITDVDCVHKAGQVGAYNSQRQNPSRNAGEPFAAVASAICIYYLGKADVRALALSSKLKTQSRHSSILIYISYFITVEKQK
jgi:hypothetical protein